MWKLTDIKNDVEYRVALCQEGARRFFKLVKENEELSLKNKCFLTELVPIELVKTRDMEEISKNVKLTDGNRFTVDAHGIWLTPAEAEALVNQESFEDIPWHEGKIPSLAPK